jgi:hypothetical protein
MPGRRSDERRQGADSDRARPVGPERQGRALPYPRASAAIQPRPLPSVPSGRKKKKWGQLTRGCAALYPWLRSFAPIGAREDARPTYERAETYRDGRRLSARLREGISGGSDARWESRTSEHSRPMKRSRWPERQGRAMSYPESRTRGGPHIGPYCLVTVRPKL